jgi:hypothetical protein
MMFSLATRGYRRNTVVRLLVACLAPTDEPHIVLGRIPSVTGGPSLAALIVGVGTRLRIPLRRVHGFCSSPQKAAPESAAL